MPDFSASPVATLLGLFVSISSSYAHACEYPFDHFPFCNSSLLLSLRVKDLLQRLQLDEKIRMLTARAGTHGSVPRLGVPEYNWGANCVHGVQSTCGTHCATSFPNPVNLGAIFDPNEIYKMAQVIGVELRALRLEGARENYKNGPHIGLDCWSPNININRDPRWGRAMETPSEDPFVNANYGVAYTKGLQEGQDSRFLQAVVTLKHYVAYSYENYGGTDRTQFDAIVSAYDFADTYFPAFEASVVDGNAKGIMCSYNSLNGVPTCANKWLNRLLREQTGFDGYITSDTGAIEGIFEGHKYTKTLCEAAKIAIESGVDICSGNAYWNCFKQLANSTSFFNAVDEAIGRTLRLRFELGLFDPIADQPHFTPEDVRTPKSLKLSMDLARRSIVLLQNNGNTLPLRRSVRIAVIGPHSMTRRGAMGNYYGQLCHGEYDEVRCVQSPLEAIQSINGRNNTIHVNGCGINDTSTSEFGKALQAAQTADVAVLFLGIDTSIERESKDRDNINVPLIQLELLKVIRRAEKPTVVVLFNGGILGIEKLILYADSVLEAFYPGIFGAQAVAEILFGDVNPSGKLPVTMYRSNFIDHVDMKSMNMTMYPGRSYRYYAEVPVFPFGWGLSYTNFSIQSMETQKERGIRPVLTTHPKEYRIQITNNGKYYGEEVIFAFFRPLEIRATGPVESLQQQLFNYTRVRLAPGEVRKVQLYVTDERLALHDKHGNLCVFEGFYELIISNGVNEQLTFPVQIPGPLRMLRPFHKSTNSKVAVK